MIVYVPVVVFGFLTWAAEGGAVPVVGLLAGSLGLAVPLIFGALGGVIGERAGVVNIAIEGQLLAGAFTAAVVSTVTGQPLLGLVGAMVAGALVAFVLGFLIVLLLSKVGNATISRLSILLALVAGTAVSFVLIGAFGLRGAAWGRIASEIIGLACAVWLARRAFAMPFPLAKLARVLAAAAVMAALVAGLNPLFEAWDKAALAALIPLGAIAYAASCWVLDVAGARDKVARLFTRLRARTDP